MNSVGQNLIRKSSPSGSTLWDRARAQLTEVSNPTFEELTQAQNRLMFVDETKGKIVRLRYRAISAIGKRNHRPTVHIDLGIKPDSPIWNPTKLGIDWRSGNMKRTTAPDSTIFFTAHELTAPNPPARTIAAADLCALIEATGAVNQLRRKDRFDDHYAALQVLPVEDTMSNFEFGAGAYNKMNLVLSISKNPFYPPVLHMYENNDEALALKINRGPVVNINDVLEPQVSETRFAQFIGLLQHRN